MPRRRHGRKETEPPSTFSLSRRDFLRLAGAGTLGLSGIWLLLEGWRTLQLNQAEVQYRHTRLEVPSLSLSPEQVKALEQESWDEEITIELPPLFEQLPLEQQRADLLRTFGLANNYVLEKMFNSIYGPFHNTAMDISANATSPSSPPSSRDGLIYFGYTVTDPGVLFTTDFKTTDDRTWYTEFALNASAFDPRTSHADPNFRKVITIAIGILHEWAHYNLTRSMIVFFRQQTSDTLSSILDRVNHYPYHEAYAWAYTSAAVLPLLNVPSISKSLLQVYIEIAKRWRDNQSQNLNWDSPEWVRQIDKKTFLPVVK